MKKLISLLGAGLLFFGGNAIAQENNLENQKKVFERLGIPERFIGYEKKLFRRHLAEDGGVLYELKDYDTNDDRRKDVRETYNKDEESTIPGNYMFDINNDGKFSDDEIWMDYFEDGLNGNERRCDLEILHMNGERL